MVAVVPPVEDPAVVGAEDEVVPVVAAVSQGAVAVEALVVGEEEVLAAAVEEVVAVALEVSPEAVDVVSSRSPGIAMRKERGTKTVNLRRCDTTCVECALSLPLFHPRMEEEKGSVFARHTRWALMDRFFWPLWFCTVA